MKVQKTKHPGIYQIGKNYYIDFYANGKRHRKVVGPKLQIALEEKTKMKKKDKRGRYHIIERMEKTTFGQLFDLYTTEGDGKKYILQFKEVYLEHFRDRKLSTITRSDLFSFRDKIKAIHKHFGGGEVTNSTVNRALAGLRRLFHFAVSKEYLDESPFPKDSKSGLFYPEKKGLRHFFTEEQVQRIVDASPLWLMPLILVSYYTGLRQGELLGLKWEWIDLEDGVFYLPFTKTLKDPTGVGQKVVMQRELIDLFKILPKKSEWVFHRADGEPFSRDHIYKQFKKILKVVGIDPKRFSWKEIRHTTGSLMHRKGVPVLAIKDQMRHTDVRTTADFYIGSDSDYQREQNEKLSNKHFKEILLGLKEDSEKTVKKEAVLNTLQEVSPIASA